MAKARDSKKFRDLCCDITGQEAPRTPYRRIKLYFTLQRRGGRPFDDDNAIALLKPLIDGIVRAGWVQDDAAAFVLIDYPISQRVGPERAVMVRIEIVE